MSEDLSHDAHLRAALRHAPDHALAPPAGVSQTILNAAHHVHKPARPAATVAPAVRITVAPPRPIAWLRQWFASPRLAGGLATGLVAALGFGLWLDLGHEPLIDRAPPEAAQAMRGPDPKSTVPDPSSGRTRTEDADHGPVVSQAPPAARADAARADAARAKRNVESAAKAEQRAEREPRQTPTASASPPERRTDGTTGHPADPLAKVNPSTPAAPPAAASPAPAPQSEAAADVTEAAPSATTTAEAKAAHPRSNDAEPGPAVPSELRMSSAARRAAAMAGAGAPAVGGTAAEAAASSPPAMLQRRIRGEMANAQARWTWLPPGKAAIVPVDEAALAWLGRLVQASGARWTDTAERAGAGDVLEARWWRDDWPQATLRIEGGGVRWIEHGGRMQLAPLDPATLQRLRSP